MLPSLKHLISRINGATVALEYAQRKTAGAQARGSVLLGVFSLGVVLACMLQPGAPAARGFAQEQVSNPPAGDVKRPRSTGPVIPAWARDARWYHVVVSRFHNGDKSNDPPGALTWTARWPRSNGAASAEGSRLDARRYGGDLQGLRHRLPYLKELGVNSLYLASIFREGTDHRHDAVDMRHVDDSLGAGSESRSVAGENYDPKTWRFSASDCVFLDLLKEVHKQDIRLVVGASFGPVRKTLPKEMSVEKHLFAITRRWMDPNADGDPSDGVDGWVLHEPRAMPHKFWKSWRAHAKKINPEALLIGDIHGDPTAWLAGDEFDVAVAYDVAMAVRRFFAGRGSTYTLKDFFADLTAIGERNALDTQLGGLVPLSTPADGRLLSALSYPVPNAGVGAKLAPDARHSEAHVRWRLATIFQHVFLGAPVTYYGDEAGMYGAGGSLSRAPMWWNDLPSPRTKHGAYRADFASLIQWLHVRRELHEPLRRGRFRPVLTDEKRGLLAFARSMPDREVILLINYGDAKQKVYLPVGEPGQLVGVVGPRLKPMPPPPPNSKRLIRPLSVGGSRRIVSATGQIRLWLNPMTVRLVIAGQQGNGTSP